MRDTTFFRRSYIVLAALFLWSFFPLALAEIAIAAAAEDSQSKITPQMSKAALRRAIERKDNISLLALLQKNRDLLEVKFGQGETPLHLAVKKNSRDMVRTLLVLGADPTVPDDKGVSPLALAEKGGNKELIGMLQRAARADATLDVAFIEAAEKGDLEKLKSLFDEFPSQEAKKMALMKAAFSGHVSIIDFLLDNGSDVNVQIRGSTALLSATGGNQTEAALLLIKKGAQVNVGTACEEGIFKLDCGTTPLMLAAAHGNLYLAKALLEAGANVNGSDRGGATALVNAIAGRDINLVKLLIEKGATTNFDYYDVGADGPGPSVMGDAENTGNPEIILLVRMQLKDTPLIKAVVRDDLNQLNRLMEQGANVDGQNATNETALMVAAHFGRVAIIRSLLDRGANVNLRDTEGKTALIHAVNAQNVEVVKLLLDYHADINLKANYERLALSDAVTDRNCAIVELLVKNGADVNIKTGYTTILQEAIHTYDSCIALTILQKAWKDENHPEEATVYLTQLLWLRDNTELVRFLLDHGADVNGTFSAAVQTGRPEIVKIYLEHGADAKQAVSAAAVTGNLETMKLFIEQGADVSDALGAAIEGGNLDIIKLVLDHGGKVYPQEPYICNTVRKSVDSDDRTIIKTLIARGADFNKTCSEPGIQATALGWARIHKDRAQTMIVAVPIPGNHQMAAKKEPKKFFSASEREQLKVIDNLIDYLVSVGAKE